MFNSIILLGGLVSAFGLGAINPIQEKQDNVNFRLENHKSVQYDDDGYEITLSADELNNYHWDNLFAFFFSPDDDDYVFNDETFDLSYDGDTFVYGDNYLGDYPDVSWEQSLGFNITFNYRGDYKFLLYNHEYVSFEYDVIIVGDSSQQYGRLKQAIELDIQANQPSNDYSPILGDIVSLLVGGITSFAGGLGAGVSALVGDIFINNGSLSVFGYMVVIFAGIALAIGLSRWVMNFLTSLGRKK